MRSGAEQILPALSAQWQVSHLSDAPSSSSRRWGIKPRRVPLLYYYPNQAPSETKLKRREDRPNKEFSNNQA
jgi:hypothetical protein